MIDDVTLESRFDLIFFALNSWELYTQRCYYYIISIDIIIKYVS